MAAMVEGLADGRTEPSAEANSTQQPSLVTIVETQDGTDTSASVFYSSKGPPHLDDLQPRPRSRVISRPRITFNEQEEDEIDSDEEWDFSVPQKSSRDSSVFERAVNPIRSLVSRQKKRFVNSRYDLDLSYITGNIIAMGYPSEGAESVYRNKMSSVQSFLEDYHKRKYKVYNLCSERAYPAVKFKNRVGYFPFDDHRCPTLTLVELFCRDVYQWLKGHEDNVAVVHCKAGKGRTGCLICCYIVYAKLCETARDAIEFFGAQRTHDGKGVTIPSQLRYIHYTEKIVIMITIPSFDPTGGCNPYFIVYSNGDDVFSTRKGDEAVPKVRGSKQKDVSWPCNVMLKGDVYIEFYDYDRLGNNELMFGVGFHTLFIGDGDSRTFKREELDGAFKKKKTFSKDFALKVKFSSLSSSNGSNDHSNCYVRTSSVNSTSN